MVNIYWEKKHCVSIEDYLYQKQRVGSFHSNQSCHDNKQVVLDQMEYDMQFIIYHNLQAILESLEVILCGYISHAFVPPFH